ncbi:MAG TPA: hypothetical protein VHL08_02765 [Dongiaceae bacterium]|nr:hypothetical protein [Dongiaceae bacterium]
MKPFYDGIELFKDELRVRGRDLSGLERNNGSVSALSDAPRILSLSHRAGHRLHKMTGNLERGQLKATPKNSAAA